MSDSKFDEYTQWVKFAKAALIGNRLAHPDASAERVAKLSFADAQAMMDELQYYSRGGLVPVTSEEK